MTQIVWVYKHCQLTVIEQPAGGYHVEIVQIAGGKPVLTKQFREMSDAIDSAHRLVDNGIMD
jgi:hypothetical protein